MPLKYQKEKIKELLQTDLQKECAAVGRSRPFEISEDALALIENYDWQGNFRELHNFATRLAVECLDETIISPDAVRRVLGDRINEELKFTAVELANAAVETEGFVNTEESGTGLALEFWQGLEWQ